MMSCLPLRKSQIFLYFNVIKRLIFNTSENSILIHDTKVKKFRMPIKYGKYICKIKYSLFQLRL